MSSRIDCVDHVKVGAPTKEEIFMNRKQERQAVFWCSLLRPVLYGEIPRGEVAAYLRKLCAEEIVFPNGRRGRPSLSTLKRKLRAFRQDGFDSLKRKARSDRGTVRAVPREVIETAVAAKRDQPLRSRGCAGRWRG